MHSTAILLEKMGAKQGCWNGHSSTTPNKVYHNAPFLTVYVHSARAGCSLIHLSNVNLLMSTFILIDIRLTYVYCDFPFIDTVVSDLPIKPKQHTKLRIPQREDVHQEDKNINNYTKELTKFGNS